MVKTDRTKIGQQIQIQDPLGMGWTIDYYTFIDSISQTQTMHLYGAGGEGCKCYNMQYF